MRLIKNEIRKPSEHGCRSSWWSVGVSKHRKKLSKRDENSIERGHLLGGAIRRSWKQEVACGKKDQEGNKF